MPFFYLFFGVIILPQGSLNLGKSIVRIEIQHSSVFALKNMTGQARVRISAILRCKAIAKEGQSTID